MNERDWQQLIWAIEEGRCAPFLGAGVSVPTLPTGRSLAADLAEEHKYPLSDSSDLARVAEYIGIKEQSPMYPKHAIRRSLLARGKPEDGDDEPHSVLARLPIPVYLTTNYVDFMAEALRERNKKPRVDFCRWNDAIADHPPTNLPPDFAPDESNPIVYHLHGHVDTPQSMVLTESDYVEFLVAISRRQVLEHQIKRALANKLLLFIGYSFADWDFKVIYGGIVAVQQSARELGITVQFDEGDEAVCSYLERYFGRRDLRVFWGDARDFLVELAERWEKLEKRK